MAGYSLPLSRWFFNGGPATNCQVTVYQSGTTTKVGLWSDNALTSPLLNPLSGNLNGEVTFYTLTTYALRVVVTTSGGQNIADIDPVFPIPNLAGFTGTGAEINYLAGATPGTALASKALVTDANNRIAGLGRVATTEGALSPYGMDKNLLIGGDFAANPWQRGTVFAAAAHNAYTADRWVYLKSGTMAHTVAREAGGPSVAAAGRCVSANGRLILTTAQASLASGDYAFEQRVEGTVFQAAAQRPFTLSFWVRSDLAGTYCVAFRNGGADRSYVAEYQVISSGAWEYKTVTVAASPTAGTWDYGTGAGLMVDFTLAAGANFQTTPNAWQAGNYLATANQVNAVASLSNVNFRLALVQLEPGPVDTKFDSRSVQQEWARCQRYYCKTFPIGTAPAAAAATPGQLSLGPVAASTSSTNAIVNWRFPVTMRVPPTVTTYTPQTAGSGFRDNSGSVIAATADFISESSCAIYNAATTAASVSRLDIHAAATAEL